MKIKTSKLTGAALDWAVAKCEDQPVLFDGECVRYAPGQFSEEEQFTPSTNWAQGGPIIDREKITWNGQSSRICKYFGGHTWQNFEEFGPTPLIAACRCLVASKLGDEVEIPEELLA